MAWKFIYLPASTSSTPFEAMALLSQRYLRTILTNLLEQPAIAVMAGSPVIVPNLLAGHRA
jgi:hypothetical protein